MSDNITLQFLGAAGTVTGSKYLVQTGEVSILIDCGLFQGPKKLRLANWENLPVEADSIDMVLLTHGHLDHCGYLPRLFNLGYRGPVLGTKPSLDIAAIILRDSAQIQEEEAKSANEEGYSKHKPAKPLYNQADAERAIKRFEAVPEGEWFNLFPEVRVRFQYAGHIIGATFIEMDIRGKRLVFSGDIGRPNDLLMRPPKKPEKADILLVESTYGGRLHSAEPLEEKLKGIVLRTIERGGTLIIPSFAVERTQTLMYVLWQLREKGEIPDVPMIMDSPMGLSVLDVFQAHGTWHQLPLDECARMCKAFRIVKKYPETWEVINNKKPKIVIAGSGMVSGGRVLTYLQYYLDKPETTVMLAGFQAEGTRGRQLLEGGSELKIRGKYYPVKAEIANLEVLSAHADQAELLDWMSDLKDAPERLFLVHGETHGANVFRVKIKDVFGWEADIPELYDRVETEVR